MNHKFGTSIFGYGALCGAVAVAGDIVAASLAGRFHFGYEHAAIPMVMLYLVLGFVVGWNTRKWLTGTLALLIAAVADATLGWFAAAEIGPARIDASAGMVAGAILFGIAFNGIIGSIGAGVGAYVSTSRLRSGGGQG